MDGLMDGWMGARWHRWDREALALVANRTEACQLAQLVSTIVVEVGAVSYTHLTLPTIYSV